MRTVSIEEHFAVPSLTGRIPPASIAGRGWPSPEQAPRLMKTIAKQLQDTGEGRIADMDANGIDMQVLSWAGPGAELMPGRHADAWARDANDALAAVIATHPTRFAGFAHLPMTLADASVAELERCVGRLGFKGALVNGTTQGRFLDDPVYAPLLACAERLCVPIYIHPNLPPDGVRQAYFGGLPEPFGYLLSTYGFGWHAEVAIHVLRLVFSGALERHRGLKVIIGHMGEFLPTTLKRTTAMAAGEGSPIPERSVAEQLRDQVFVTTSGQFDVAALTALVATFGLDRVLFSVDYPYSSNAEGRAFLDGLPLAPEDLARIAHRNADALLKLDTACR